VNSERVVFNIRDTGGRRSGIDRRRFNYSGHFPERRSGKDRRGGLDRRSGEERRRGEITGSVREPAIDQRQIVMRERRSGADRRDFMIL
jgi:hypothetical protein